MAPGAVRSETRWTQATWHIETARDRAPGVGHTSAAVLVLCRSVLYSGHDFSQKPFKADPAVVTFRWTGFLFCNILRPRLLRHLCSRVLPDAAGHKAMVPPSSHELWKQLLFTSRPLIFILGRHVVPRSLSRRAVVKPTNLAGREIKRDNLKLEISCALNTHAMQLHATLPYKRVDFALQSLPFAFLCDRLCYTSPADLLAPA
jgi:hypothetical protein